MPSAKKAPPKLLGPSSELGERISSFAHPVQIIDADDAVEDAARLMVENQIGSILVSEHNKRDRPIGILTEWDLLSRVSAKGKDVTKTRVREVMSSPLITASAEERVADAMRLMINRGIRRLAVLEDGVLVGLVTLTQMVGNRRRSSSPIPIVEPLVGYVCPYCNSTFRLRNQLTKHIGSSHFGTLKMLKEEHRRPPAGRARKSDYAVFEIEEEE